MVLGPFDVMLNYFRFLPFFLQCSFQGGNTLFQTGKQLVSLGETSCYPILHCKETDILVIR